MNNNTVTSVGGFSAGGVSCGVKQSGKLDLGMIVCSGGARAAAVFTTNKVVSGSVTVCRDHLLDNSKKITAIVVNSGNANACTGDKGVSDAEAMCNCVGQKLGIDSAQVLICSTGIIGEFLPIDKIIKGIESISLGDSADFGLSFAKSIMTTDTRAKQAVRNFSIGSKLVTIAGTVKGSGMIAPNMATTLMFITTDADISQPLLDKSLTMAIADSLNKLSIDIHQSTNDTAILLASGASGNAIIDTENADYAQFASNLHQLCDNLAQQMALDAEGATRMFKVVIDGAATKAEAATAARAVVDSPLVKCAVNGGDPNWGRIICAVGSCGVDLALDKLSCRLDDLVVFENGVPKAFDSEKAGKIISQTSCTITVDLGAGRESDFCYGCDLSKDYVTINADYHT